MAEPVRARRLTDQEGQRLQQIVRRGKHESVRVRRAVIIMASASGTLVPAIARLVAADEDTFRMPGCASRPRARRGPIRSRRSPGPRAPLSWAARTHRNHPALARRLQACLRWRNAHARHPGVLAAQRRERARIRSERQQRRGRPKPNAA